jgi:hypothetical protein
VIQKVYYWRSWCFTHPQSPGLAVDVQLHADPPAGDVGSNAQEAACPPAVAAADLARPGNGYAYGQALTVVGSIPPAAAGLKVRGQLALPVGVLSAECMDVQQVGYMTRVPASLKVSSSRLWMYGTCFRAAI